MARCAQVTKAANLHRPAGTATQAAREARQIPSLLITRQQQKVSATPDSRGRTSSSAAASLKSPSSLLMYAAFTRHGTAFGLTDSANLYTRRALEKSPSSSYECPRLYATVKQRGVFGKACRCNDACRTGRSPELTPRQHTPTRGSTRRQTKGDSDLSGNGNALRCTAERQLSTPRLVARYRGRKRRRGGTGTCTVDTATSFGARCR